MVIYAWKHVAKDECTLDGFGQYGYFDFDVSIDKLHSEIHETIKNGKVQNNLVKAVKAFSDEIK